MEPSITLTGATVAFGTFRALDAVALELPKGKVIGLLGPSGAGKTTLMRVVVGRQRLSQGTALVDSLPVGHRKLRGHIGYMTQAISVYPDLSVIENMHYFATIMGVPRAIVPKYLGQVDMTAQTKQLAGTLSGGQKSRLSLAVALLGDPELLVLDEPTVGVDPVLRQQLWTIFRDLAGKGATVLVSSHVMDEANRCDDLVLIRNGQVIAHDTPAALRASTRTEDIESTFLKLVEAPA